MACLLVSNSGRRISMCWSRRRRSATAVPVARAAG